MKARASQASCVVVHGSHGEKGPPRLLRHIHAKPWQYRVILKVTVISLVTQMQLPTLETEEQRGTKDARARLGSMEVVKWY